MEIQDRESGREEFGKRGLGGNRKNRSLEEAQRTMKAWETTRNVHVVDFKNYFGNFCFSLY